jgi:hypothetical protein
LSIGNNIKKEVEGFHQSAENETAIDHKLDELVMLLSKTQINSDDAKRYRQKFDNALNRKGISTEQVEAFKSIENSNASREDLLDEFSILLASNQFDSRVTKKRRRTGDKMSRVVLFIISITMITLGFGMIIMPAPPFFEMFTIFYFNPNDGITIMDLISLLVVLFGVFFLIKAIIRNPASR